MKRFLPPMTGAHVAAVIGALACHLAVFALLNSEMTVVAIGIFLYSVYNLQTGDDPLMFVLALLQIGLLLGFGVSQDWSTLTLFGAGCAVFGAMQLSMLARLMRREALIGPAIVGGFGAAIVTVALMSVLAVAALLVVRPVEAETSLPLVVSILAAAVALVLPALLIRRRSARPI